MPDLAHGGDMCIEQRRLPEAPWRRKPDGGSVRRGALELVQLRATIDQP
jgi:hypothetical protein